MREVISNPSLCEFGFYKLFIFILTPLLVFLFPLSKKKVVFLAHPALFVASFSSQDYYLSLFGSLAGHPQTVIGWLYALLRSSCTLPTVDSET